jgi:hypothetical protein
VANVNQLTHRRSPLTALLQSVLLVHVAAAAADDLVAWIGTISDNSMTAARGRRKRRTMPPWPRIDAGSGRRARP